MVAMVGAIALVVLVVGTAASLVVSFGAHEEERRQLLAQVTASASALETELASVREDGGQHEADVAAAAELAAELSAVLELPAQWFDAAARAEIERALAELVEASSSPPAPNETIVLVRDGATLDELRSAETALAVASADLDDRAEELEALRSELAEAIDAARASAEALVDGIVGGTEGLLAVNAAASVESSDRVRTIVATLEGAWTADGLREWIDAVTALEASSAEAAARLDVGDRVVDAGTPTVSAPDPGWAPTWPTEPTMSSPPPPPPLEPEPTPVDTWPVIWNEHWRPYADCVGNMGLVKMFETTDYGYGLESGMTTPWTHDVGMYGVLIYSCGS